jgi:hypothetical protein
MNDAKPGTYLVVAPGFVIAKEGPTRIVVVGGPASGGDEFASKFGPFDPVRAVAPVPK